MERLKLNNAVSAIYTRTMLPQDGNQSLCLNSSLVPHVVSFLEQLPNQFQETAIVSELVFDALENASMKNDCSGWGATFTVQNGILNQQQGVGLPAPPWEFKIENGILHFRGA